MPARAPDVAAVVFDIGGVLLDWDPKHLYMQLLDGDEERVDRFLAEVCTREWHERTFDMGVPHAEACAARTELFPEHADLIAAWQRQEDMIAGVHEGTVEVVRELRGAGVPRYVLSNMDLESWERRVNRFEFLTWFDGVVLSGIEKVKKPDAEIFRRLLGRFDLDPSSTLFVDDVQANVDAATAVGLQGHQFTSAGELRRVLRASGAPIGA